MRASASKRRSWKEKGSEEEELVRRRMTMMMQVTGVLSGWVHTYLKIDDDGLLSSVGELLLLQAPPQIVVSHLQLCQQPRLSHRHGVHVVATE
jgi:hypothetical protein